LSVKKLLIAFRSPAASNDGGDDGDTWPTGAAALVTRVSSLNFSLSPLLTMGG
jgi:hypothetical protein